VKFGQEDEFLYETTGKTSNDALIRELVQLNNTRVRIAYLCGSLRELAEHGPAKPQNEAGLDHIMEEMQGKKVEKSSTYEEDPTGNRTGNGVGDQMTQVFEDVCNDGEAYISKNQAKLRKALTQAGCGFLCGCAFLGARRSRREGARPALARRGAPLDVRRGVWSLGTRRGSTSQARTRSST